MAIDFAQWGNDLYAGRRSYDIVGHRRRWFTAAAVLVLITVAVLLFKGLNPGIEFRGGSEFVVSGSANSSQTLASDTVSGVVPNEVSRVSGLGDNSLRIQTGKLAADQIVLVRDALAKAYEVPSANIDSQFIGPSWGKDVSSKAIKGIIVFLVLAALVMTAYFRTWRMASAAIIALLHDLVVTVGIYAIVGWEVTPATVIGFMTILAYSIYDTVVVFDKVRENTKGITDQTRWTYAEKANLAVNQTLVRSINTSVVALLPVSAILFVGSFLLKAGTLRDISLALFVGMAVGALSSIYLATPLEVAFQNGNPSIKAHTAKVLAARAKAVAAGGAAGAPSMVGAGAIAIQPRPGTHLGNAAQPRKRKPR